eukprot:16439848-Heterocapsa_arctica.AAC.1
MGICFNGVEETERSLFKLKFDLVQEEGRKKQEEEAGALKDKDRNIKQEEDRRQAELAQHQQDLATRESQRSKACAYEKFVQDKQVLSEIIEKEEREEQNQRDEAQARELQIEEDRKAAIRLEQLDREE